MREDDLLLPAQMDLAPDAEANAGLYLLRAVLGGALAREEGPLLQRLDRAIPRLREELAGFGPAWEEALALQAQAGRVVLWGPLLEVNRAPSADEGEGEGPPSREASEAEALPIEEVDILALKEEEALQLPIHAFEKVEMAEPFNGTLRQLDGSDDLDDHLEALEEVNLGQMLRGGPQAHSLLRAEIALDASVPEVGDIDPDDPGIAYPEWDGGAGRYKPDWARVYPAHARAEDPAWAGQALIRTRRTVDRLYAELCRHRDRLSEQPRQLDGEQVDVDALTEAWASRRAGCDPDPRLYIRQARQRRDLATCVLLDISLSSDAWVDNRRVLDVARDSAFVLGEVCDRLGDRLQLQAFASHTRHKVRSLVLRDWHEPWARARGRLGALQPQGYTRIGPALRHAVAGLRRVPARHRLLLLVSDGKPTDYDRYEGRYGMADVRQALREARAAGVRTHALTIEQRASDWLPAMMGPGAWSILPRPEALPEALARVYGRMS